MTRELRMRRTQQRSGGFGQIVWVFAAFVLGYVTAGFYDMASLTRLIDRMQDQSIAAKPAVATPQSAIPPKPQFEFYTLLTKDSQGNIKRVAPAQAMPVQALARNNAPNASIERAAERTSSQTLNARSSLKQPPAIVAGKLVASSSTPVVSQPRIAKPVVIQSKPLISESTARFLIQIAAFNRREDAEHLKANLLLKGYDASVMAYDARPGVHWFRVVIGPYQNKTEVVRLQTSLLQRYHIRGIIRQV